jgi:hypothetical protein
MILFVDDVANQLGVSLEALLAALYQLVRTDPSLDRFAIVNAGCSADELVAAEQRIGLTLPPLHRFLLRLSNGGTLPFINSLSLFAAAVPRESEWRIVGPFLSPEEVTAIKMQSYRFTHPIRPLLLGEGEANLEAHTPNNEDLIIFAAGFGGQEWGYQRGASEQIMCWMPWAGRAVEANSFEQFLREQTLTDRCATPAFLERVHATLQEK